jgi:hypothetical protein
MKILKRQATQVQRGPVITYDPTGLTLYGGPAAICCPPLFDLSCSDGSVGIFHTGGEFTQALAWFGRRPARAVHEETNYLQYMGAVRKATADTSLPAVPEEICAPGDSASFGASCKDVKDCFGVLKVSGEPVVNGGNSLPYCERDLRVTIDGQVIADDRAWHEANVTEALLNAYVYNLMWGYRNTTNQKFGHWGLASLLHAYPALDPKNYVYPCPELQPKVLDWNNNEACSPTAMAGITLNGVALADDFRTNLYATLRAILRALIRQINRTRGLTSLSFNYGDWAILGPSEVFDCLIQCAVCFTECANNCLNLDTERAALAMQELRTGGIGWGELNFDGIRVPFIPFDPALFVEDDAGAVTVNGSLRNANGTFNLMLLYRGSGNNRVLQPEYNPLDDGTWPTRDNGMIQLYEDSSDICVKPGTRTEWRWDKRGSMFQTLIKNVKCDSILPSSILITPTAATSTCP